MNRRILLLGAAALMASGACTAAGDEPASDANEARFADSSWRRLSDAEWRARLSPGAYQVLRHEGTERPGSSPLLNEHRAGVFVCAGCALPLFRSAWKYESGTGWPSFFRIIAQNHATKTDHVIGYPRTEYHCARCLGHQGHVFDDGPAPTGLRYCNNGVALRFAPA